MNLRRFSIIIFLLLTFCGFAFSQESALVQPVQSTDLSKNPNETVKLSGPWNFYWGKFLNSEEAKTTAPDCVVNIPSSWNNYPSLPEDAEKYAKLGKGSGTYYLNVTGLEPNALYGFRTYDLASTAIRIYANNVLCYEAGNASEDWNETKMDQKMELATFNADSNGEVLLLLHISNKVYRKGGLWNSINIAKYETAADHYSNTISLYSILAGIIFAVMIYGLFLFTLKKDISSLFLSLFCFSLFIRFVSSDFPLLKQYFTFIPYPVMLRLEFSALFLSPIFYTLYLKNLDDNIFLRVKVRYPVGVGCVFGIVIFFFPVSISNWIILPLQVYLIAVILMDLIALFIYLIKFKNYIGFYCVGTVGAIMLCALNDILLTKQKGIHIFGSELLPFSFAIFSFCQTVIQAVIQIKSEGKVHELYDFLSETNKAYQRFVPKQFLELFNKKDIVDLEIGEHSKHDMMILSADIRNFTAISENLTGIQVFEFLNGYFAQIAPVIKKHGGIIEKYLGDGIIVFFKKNYEEALYCAIEMQEKMIELRQSFSEKGLPQLKIGIGIHFGNILVGTAGDASRMSEVSISTELSVLQHVESATKRYHKSIIVTKEAMGVASKDVQSKGKKFLFKGEKIPDTIGHQLYYIYNDNISKDL